MRYDVFPGSLSSGMLIPRLHAIYVPMEQSYSPRREISGDNSVRVSQIKEANCK